MKRQPTFLPVRRLRGFTLVELMVGMLLGLLTVIVITQVLAMAESQKRSINSGNDAQVNGALASYTIQRDVQMGGYGLSSNAEGMGCPVRYGDDPGETFTMVPVRIVDGEDGKPDAITVVMSSSQSFTLPLKVTENHLQASDYFVVQSTLGVAEGDVLVAVPADTSAWSDTNRCAVFVATGAITDTRINHEAPLSGVVPADGYRSNSYLVNAGSLAFRSYSVSDAQNLQMETFSVKSRSSATQDLFPQIVNLQALYGLTLSGNTNVVTSYSATTPADYTRVRSLRVAVVARNSERQKEVVTTSEPEWDLGKDADVDVVGSYTCKNGNKCVRLKVNFGKDTDTDWQYYSYRVYDTVMPLRNVLWSAK